MSWHFNPFPTFDATLSTMLLSPSQTVLHVIFSLTDCPPCYFLPHRLSSMLLSPSQTVLHVILSLTHCPPCYSLSHRLSSMLFSPSQTVPHTVLHVIFFLIHCPPCYSLPHRLSSMLFSPSQTVLHADNEEMWMPRRNRSWWLVQQSSSHTTLVPSLLCGLAEDGNEEEEREKMETHHNGKDREMLDVWTLARLTNFMYRCLSCDSHVTFILPKKEYWLSTLIDPRYKGNFESLLLEVETWCYSCAQKFTYPG
ncbi:unnamed protein product, partial [Ranitomeya imitator]